MKLYNYPTEMEWGEIVMRPRLDTSKLNETVAEVLSNVKFNGDVAVKKYELAFDHVALDSLLVSKKEVDEAFLSVDSELINAISLAHANIYKFHSSQKVSPVKVETAPGVECWQRCIAIEKVGLYIPGGTAPLFSTVLMLAIPAKLAGCREIVLCTPPGRDGRVNPAIIAAAKIAGVDKIFKIGGVQAIAAMAYGTESVPKVYKIFGPGNQYVMAAKQQVSLCDVAIDMPAGPSEVCVIADEDSNAEYVAADLLSQAEHGVDSQVLLICTSVVKLEEIKLEIEKQLRQLPRRNIASETLKNSKLVLVHDTNEAIRLSNLYAPEHLIIATKDYERLAEKVVNAGSVFLGEYACESAGDYASGTNHTLPTHGYATSYNGVNLDSFIRKVTFQYLTAKGVLSIGRTVEVMAANECLDAHKKAMALRLCNVMK